MCSEDNGIGVAVYQILVCVTLWHMSISGWNKASIKTQCECGHKRTEVIWYNYSLDQMTLSDFI